MPTRVMVASLVLAACLASPPWAASVQLPPPPLYAEDFEQISPGEAVDPWGVPTGGYKATVATDHVAGGERAMRLEWVADEGAPFGNWMRTFDATPYVGCHVKLSAKVRVESSGAGVAQMWLRVDRPNGQMGAFDNMGDRPIHPGEWQDAVIEADIDADGQILNIGFMSIRHATVWIDSIRLEAVGEGATLQWSSPAAPLSARGLENLCAAARLLAYVRFFDASDSANGVKAWDHFAIDVIERVESASDAEELAHRLNEAFAPISPTLQLWVGTPAQAPPAAPIAGEAVGLAHWHHVGAGSIDPDSGHVYWSAVKKKKQKMLEPTFDDAARDVVKSLAGGVSCRLTLRVGYDAGGTLPHKSTPRAWTDTKSLPWLTAENRATRLAGVASAWGIFQHFYPYFDVVGTDWDAALPVALAKAAQDTTETAYLETLRELVAKLHDGHGGVYKRELMPESVLPIRVEWIGRDLVVVGTNESVPDKVELGDVVLSIDGRSAEDCHDEVSRFISAATEGWRRYRSQSALVSDLPTKDPASFVFRRPDGSEYSAHLARGPRPARYDGPPKKPDDGAELAPGIVYFDLDGADDDELREVVAQLDAAAGIVFDLRGYPNAAAMTVLRRLAERDLESARWNVPIVTRPDREEWTWNTGGRWNLKPIEPRWTAAVAFLTDGRAISYAESILGIVEHYDLGEIVGSTTAGTNGNVNPFELPGGYHVAWTGMKVLKHDGSQHHGVGILPTVRVIPTPLGIAQGRDEVLERAVEVVKAKIASQRK